MTEVGNVSGEALYDLAKAEALSKIIGEQLHILQQSFQQEPDFIRLLSSPNLSKAERCRILDDSFRDKVHTYVLNFLKILTERGYMRHFCDCCDAYAEHYNADNGILRVTAVTAVAMSDAQKAKLTDKLHQLTGKEIQLLGRIDPAILGGIRLDYDGKRVDGTVKNRLDSVRELLKNTVI